MSKIPIHRHEDVELARRAAKQLAILDAAPASALHGVYLVRTEVLPKSDRNILIK